MKVKRYRKPIAKDGELKAVYGKQNGEEDVYYCNGGGDSTSADARMLANFFGFTKVNDKTLLEELAGRGYDITTLKFSIQLHSQQESEG